MSEHDPHLKEALRHAPDAHVQPPASLSALILNEARAKARTPSALPREPHDRRGPLITLWDWLARPSVATGLAGVMAATLVGVMWWGEPMDQALPRRPGAAPPPPAEAVATATPAAPVEAPVPATDATPPAALAGRPAPTDAAANVASTSTPGAALERKAAAPATPPAPTKAPPVKATPAAGGIEPRAKVAEDKAEARAAMAEAAPVPVPAPAPAPATATAPKLAAQRTAPPPARHEPEAAAPMQSFQAPAPAAPPVATGTAESATGRLQAGNASSADESARDRSALRVDALKQRELADAGKELERAKAADSSNAGLTRLRAAIAAEPTRWTWQRGSEPAQAMNDAVYAWLAQLDRSASAAWRPRTERDTTAPLGAALHLIRDGQLMHSLSLTERGAQWAQGQTSWEAALSLVDLQALQRTAP